MRAVILVLLASALFVVGQTRPTRCSANYLNEKSGSTCVRPCGEWEPCGEGLWFSPTVEMGLEPCTPF